MSKYVVTLSYDATIEVEVECNNEGEALDKARDYAERDAGINQFHICNERNSRVRQTE